jgi:hypothetical protein
VPELAEGGNTVTFGSEGCAEWRRLPSAALAQISGGTARVLYDAGLNVVGSGTTFPAMAPAHTPGCHLLLFGRAGTGATVTVALPVGTPKGR